MKIDHPIVDRMGRDLVVRGAKVDEYEIEALIKRGIMTVYIQENVEEPPEEERKLSDSAKRSIEQYRTEDPVKVTLSDSVRKQVSEGIQTIYNDTGSEAFADTTNSIAGSLLAAIEENDAMAIDISSLKTSDEYTFKHSVDVATIGMVIGKKLGLSNREIYEIGIAGLLHDVGKTRVPPEILNKPDRLDKDEFEIMKQHSVFGYRILQEHNDYNDAISLGVLQHHEKMNGSGYPIGADADNISPYARILTVADIYDALVTERPYKSAFSQRDAVEMIMSMTSELDLDAMRAFLESTILYPVDSYVELSNGEVARVVKNHSHFIMRPTVVGVKSGNVYNLGEDMACANIVIK
jgi:HD-GYP domain-containing protein (c-di-GMP phosphodiesterase class II)